jgi:cytochrome d ubiquinol oxidase subunit II
VNLTELWFLIIAFLWLGYFVLEGFDFGVGMLLPVVGRDETDRRVAINTIGPVWDGNEVWLIVAGASTFAAFPEWYATLFSGFYLPLLLIVLALIVRAVSFEFRGKRAEARWKAGWDAAIIAGSAVPALLWGVAFGNIVRGVPLDARHEFIGSLGGLLNPYALLFGLTTLALFATHGAIFLALKTHGPVRHRARRIALPVGLVAAVAAVAFLTWTQLRTGTVLSAVLATGAAVARVTGLVASRMQRDGIAFAGTAVAIGLAVVSLFAAIYPDVLPATDPANSLTIHNASSTPYTLRVMSWVALAFTPFVLAYQAWSYWVFRRRLGRRDIAGAGE